MNPIGNLRLLLVVCSLALLGCGYGPSAAAAEKLSADQKAPQFANSSAGAGSSLALPRAESAGGGKSSALGQLLAGLRIKASGQTPADTSLLSKLSSKRTGGASRNALELLHIKASGQTPADTSLLPRRQQSREPEETPSSQSRRVGGQRGPAHVTLIGPEQSSAGRQTPANVGLLKPGGAGPPSRPAAAGGAQQQDDVQREEMSSFKEVNGESVRVVVGNYGYDSPEGLPVSFKYMSDENGNQASFSIGTPGAGGGSGGGGSSSRPGGAGGGSGGGSRGTAAGGGAGKGKTGGATGAGGGEKYLPPK